MLTMKVRELEEADSKLYLSPCRCSRGGGHSGLARRRRALTRVTHSSSFVTSWRPA
jgi:hypothetical protein